jgi:glycerol-3-phosphate cytidylyltransferase
MFRTTLTIGTFDVPHIGHAVLIQRCKQLAQVFAYVGVNTDEFVEKYKGVRPVFTLAERREYLQALQVATVINDGPGRDLIYKIKPDALIIGSDWLGRDYLAQINMTAQEFTTLGITLIYLPYTEGISTTEIKRRLSEGQ